MTTDGQTDGQADNNRAPDDVRLFMTVHGENTVTNF